MDGLEFTCWSEGPTSRKCLSPTRQPVYLLMLSTDEFLLSKVRLSVRRPAANNSLVKHGFKIPNEVANAIPIRSGSNRCAGISNKLIFSSKGLAFSSEISANDLFRSQNSLRDHLKLIYVPIFMVSEFRPSKSSKRAVSHSKIATEPFGHLACFCFFLSFLFFS